MSSTYTHKELPKRIYFLELVRSLAAIYVFVYHILQKLHVESVVSKAFFSFGQEAVMLFFVLSGFVIYYSQKLKGNRLHTSNYILGRFSRIYPVFIFALVISYLSVCLNAGALVSMDLPMLLKNIFMLQDFSVGKPGVWVDAYMSNGPLWSLSYEWWFYILFIPVLLIKPIWQIHAVFILSILSMLIYLIVPNQICLWLSYFLIWWCGVEAAKKYLNQSLNKPFIPIVYLIIIIALLVGYTSIEFEGILQFGIFPILFIRHFAMALVFYLFLILVDVTKISVKETNLLVRLAPYSYAFYVLHYPILNLFKANNWLEYSVLLLIPMTLIIICLVYIAEEIVHKYLSKKLKVFYRS